MKNKVSSKNKLLECISFSSSTSSSPSTSAPNRPPSQEGTSTPSVSREYNLTMEADSYNEIRSMIQGPPLQGQLHHLLRPDRQHVQETLFNTKSSSADTRLISSYFDHTETASEFCLHLHECLHRARDMYAPLLDLIAITHPTKFDYDHMTQSHCYHALDLFYEFDSQDNPFPDSHNVDFTNIHTCLSDLKKQLDSCLKKSRSRIRLLRHATTGSAVCFVVAAVGMIAAAVVVTVHAVAAFAVAGCVPVCDAHIAYKKRELARLGQLDATAKVACVLSNDLDTIYRLVARLHTAVEADKYLVRVGLKRGSGRYSIQEVLKQLCQNYKNFLPQLEDLEEHITLFLYAVNKARSLLFQEICDHQTL